MELGVYSTVSMLCSSLGGSTAFAMFHKQESSHYTCTSKIVEHQHSPSYRSQVYVDL